MNMIQGYSYKYIYNYILNLQRNFNTALYVNVYVLIIKQKDMIVINMTMVLEGISKQFES